MHNRVPQMGYYDKGLGRYVYQSSDFGNLWTDLESSINNTINKIGGQAQTQVQTAVSNTVNDFISLPNAAKSAFMSEMLATQTGQSAVEEAKQTWMAEQAAKLKAQLQTVRTYVTANPATSAAIAIGLGAAVYFLLLRKK